MADFALTFICDTLQRLLRFLSDTAVKQILVMMDERAQQSGNSFIIAVSHVS